MATDEIATGGGWRFKAGVALIALMVLAWLLIPIEAALGMSGGTIAATTAGIATANKVILLLAIVVMGKPGFQELKAKLLHRLTPATEVSPMRYRIGLVMFCLPILQGLLETWASHIAPELVANRLWVDILMDGMMIASLFVLGGNFWDKLRAVFVADARAVFPKDAPPIAVV
jgi:uncharacterized membrane protein